MQFSNIILYFLNSIYINDLNTEFINQKVHLVIILQKNAPTPIIYLTINLYLFKEKSKQLKLLILLIKINNWGKRT